MQNLISTVLAVNFHLKSKLWGSLYHLWPISARRIFCGGLYLLIDLSVSCLVSLTVGQIVVYYGILLWHYNSMAVRIGLDL